MWARVVALLAVLLLGSCAGKRYLLPAPEVARPPASGRFLAGAAEVEITPPPGLPIGGWSRSAGDLSAGARTRLHARALVLEDAVGERLAVVSAELWSVSALLHREVARRIAELGIGPDRLMLAATHTHSGPGAFSGQGFYDDFASGQPGFDEAVLAWLAERIAASVREAVERRAPACLALGEARATGLTRNRSLPAWRANFDGAPLPPEDEAVDDRLRVLRVERRGAAGAELPIAAWIAFAVHGTAFGTEPGVWHGDVPGILTQVVGEQGLVAGFLNGAEGDVSPTVTTPGAAETTRLGRALAEVAREAWANAGARECDPDVRLAHAYREVVLPGAATALGPVCERALSGLPTVGGAEDGRSFLHGWFGAWEGNARSRPQGCQSRKKPVLGLLGRLIYPAGDFPRQVPFQIFRLGSVVTLIAMPGELTRELGRRVEEAVASDTGLPAPIVVGLANDYLSYWTTQAEYEQQHYEGGSTLYGPHQGLLAVEQARELGFEIRDGVAARRVPAREFRTGSSRRFLRRDRPCRGDGWRELQTALLPEDPRTGAGTRAWLDWRGSSPRESCDPIPRVLVLCAAGNLQTVIAAARGDEVEVRYRGGERWRATWFVPADMGARDCHIEVARPGGGSLRSETFRLP